MIRVHRVKIERGSWRDDADVAMTQGLCGAEVRILEAPKRYTVLASKVTCVKCAAMQIGYREESQA